MSGGLVYFRDGELLGESGEARVYKMNGELYLEIGSGHTLWAYEGEIVDYRNQLQDFPTGNCLEIGLGLGVISRYLQTFPKVKDVTTIEINKDVIDVHSKIKESDRGVVLNYSPERHRILHSDGISYAYQTKRKYDFIFIDCYDHIDEDTLPLIADVVQACSRVVRPGGKILGWMDKYTSEPYYSVFCQIFNNWG